jgi:hypothetical protein
MKHPLPHDPSGQSPRAEKPSLVDSFERVIEAAPQVVQLALIIASTKASKAFAQASHNAGVKSSPR